MLLDELTTFLDIGHQLEVLELARRLNEEKGITIVLVLHDLNHAARYASRMVVLNEGSIAADGAPTDVLNERFCGTCSVFAQASSRTPGPGHRCAFRMSGPRPEAVPRRDGLPLVPNVRVTPSSADPSGITARRCARHQHERQAMKLGEPGTSVTVVSTMDETDESPAQSTHNIGKHDSGGDQSEHGHSS